MKKILSAIFITVCVIVTGVILSACKSEPPCEHVWSNWKTVYASCSADGEQQYICKLCYTLEVKNLGKDITVHVDENLDGICEDCGEDAYEKSLRYELNEDGQSYYVLNRGHAKTKAIILSEYKGLPVTGIGPGAFRLCGRLTRVEIPDTVTSIGSSAFEDCKQLTDIEIPDTVTSIGGGAFRNCESLVSIIIPENVITIPEGAFYNCKSLIDVKISSGVTSFENYAFCGCTGLTGVEIPENVTSIGENAFYGCTGLTSVKIPENVTSIGEMAFYNCENLTDVEIPSGITDIGGGAFDKCGSLRYNEYDSAYYLGNAQNPYLVLVKAKNADITSCKINSNTKIVCDRAFLFCKNLTSIEIPKGVISIGTYVFGLCDSLTSVEVDKDNEVYLSAGNCIIDRKTKSLIAGCKSSVIPSDGSVTTIGFCAFWACKGLVSIEIPEGVTRIEVGAFSGCDSLTSMVIPSTLTSIEGDDLYYCGNLSYNEFENGCYLGNDQNPYLVLVKVKNTDITSCEINNKARIIGCDAFKDCIMLESVEIPQSVISIGYSAFDGCSSLTSVVIPDSVTSIGNRAFEDCENLTSIVIPQSVTVMGHRVFNNCKNITVYCDAESKPDRWDNEWNGSSDGETVWCYEGE